MDLHFPGTLCSGLAHICAPTCKVPKPRDALGWRGTRRRSGVSWILVIQDIVLAKKIQTIGWYIFFNFSFLVFIKSAKAFFSGAYAPVLAAHPHLQGVATSAGLSHCLAGNLSRRAHLSRSETSSLEPVSQCPEREHREFGKRRLGLWPTKMRHQPDFLTIIVICSDPTVNKSKSCSQSCLCNVHRTSRNV